MNVFAKLVREQIYTCTLFISDSVVVLDGTGDQGSFVRGGDTTVAGDGAGARHGSIVAAEIKDDNLTNRLFRKLFIQRVNIFSIKI